MCEASSVMGFPMDGRPTSKYTFCLEYMGQHLKLWISDSVHESNLYQVFFFLVINVRIKARYLPTKTYLDIGPSCSQNVKFLKCKYTFLYTFFDICWKIKWCNYFRKIHARCKKQTNKPKIERSNNVFQCIKISFQRKIFRMHLHCRWIVLE